MTLRTLRLGTRILVLIGNPAELKARANKTVRGSYALYLDTEV
jgi:hypothetical protein